MSVSDVCSHMHIDAAPILKAIGYNEPKLSRIPIRGLRNFASDQQQISEASFFGVLSVCQRFPINENQQIKQKNPYILANFDIRLELMYGKLLSYALFVS